MKQPASTLHRVITRDDYFAELEEIPLDVGKVALFFHVRFLHFNATVLKQALVDWRLFRAHFTRPIFAVAGDDYGPKFHEFVSLFGFTPTGTRIALNNGELRELYLSKVNERHVFHPNTTGPATEQPLCAGGTGPENGTEWGEFCSYDQSG